MIALHLHTGLQPARGALDVGPLPITRHRDQTCAGARSAGRTAVLGAEVQTIAQCGPLGALPTGAVTVCRGDPLAVGDDALARDDLAFFDFDQLHGGAAG